MSHTEDHPDEVALGLLQLLLMTMDETEETPMTENTTGRPQDGRGEVARGDGTPAGRTGAYEAATTIDETEED